jgi:transposase
MEPKLKSINSINSIQKLTQLLRESSNDAVISTKIQNRIEKLRLKNKKIKNVVEPVEDTEEEMPYQDVEGNPITLFKSKQLLNKYCTNYNKKTPRRKSPTELDIQMIEKHIKGGSFCNQVDKSFVIDEPQIQLPATETVILDIKELFSLENDYDIIELKLVMRNKIKN